MSAGAVARGGGGTAPGGAVEESTSPPLPERPRLGQEVRLVGQMRESAYADPPWLIDRGGAGYLQVSRLLYRIAELSDGRRTVDEIAKTITDEGEPVQSQTIARNLAGLLIPSGVVIDGNGELARPASRSASPLALQGRMKMLGPGAIEPLTGFLKLAFAPPIAIAIVLAALVSRVWLYGLHGIAGPARAALDRPVDLLILFVLIVLSAGFHEFGHAAALRYGGGRVRGMGVGLYMIYPAVYTDVTENYRLPRWSRVRTDLGGFHFNLIFSLAVLAAALATNQQFLLIFLLLTDLEIIQQSMPFVRFDGYWALADVTGIPDFFTHMGVFWRRLLRRPLPPGTQIPELKPWGRAVLAVYSLVTVPVLLVLLFLMVAALPRVLATAWGSGAHQVAAASGAWNQHQVLAAVFAVLQVLILAFPAAASVLMLGRAFKQFQTRLWRWAGNDNGRRAGAALATCSTLALCGFLWAPALPHGGRGAAVSNLTPIAPAERGTFGDLVGGASRSLADSTTTAAGAPAPSDSSTPGTTTGGTNTGTQPSPGASPSVAPSAKPSPSSTP